jgi:predicted dehydrogenase
LGVHFFDLVYAFTGAKYPRPAVAISATYRWRQDGFTVPDSIETILDYPDEGFMARYCTASGNGANSYMRVIGTRGMLDCTNWKGFPTVTGVGAPEQDRLPRDAKVPPVETTPHMKNFLNACAAANAPARPSTRVTARLLHVCCRTNPWFAVRECAMIPGRKRFRLAKQQFRGHYVGSPQSCAAVELMK